MNSRSRIDRNFFILCIIDIRLLICDCFSVFHGFINLFLYLLTFQVVVKQPGIFTFVPSNNVQILKGFSKKAQLFSPQPYHPKPPAGDFFFLVSLVKRNLK